MTNLNVFEAFKEDTRSNFFTWLRQLPIISYGYITEIVNDTIVRVVPVIQETPDFTRVYDVTLVGLSSAMFELNIQPQEKDLVLLFSLNRFNSLMFDLPIVRTEQGTIIDDTLNGYSSNAMIGILASTFKAVSALQIVLKQDGGQEPIANINIDMKTSILSLRSFDFGFSSGDGQEHPIRITIKEKRPANINIRSPIQMQFGFDGTEENNAVNASVHIKRSKLAPLTEINEASCTRTFKEDAVVTDTYEAANTQNFTGSAPYKINSETHVDVNSKEPVGINAGLRKIVLKPYWDAEKKASNRLAQAASRALIPMSILDGMSGGTGFFIALGREIMSFARALVSADTSAIDDSEPIVK